MKGYVFIDYATQAYIALVGLLILVFHGDAVASWPALCAAHAIALVGIHGMIRWHATRPAVGWLNFLRHFYPVILYTGFYRETGALNRMFIPDFVDPLFIYMDQFLFRCQPSLVFMDTLPYLWVSELFFAAYFSYYVMITGVGIALFLRNRAQFFHYISVVSFVFYLCYLCYIVLPVIGPRTFFREIDGYRLPQELEQMAASSSFPKAIESGPFYQAVKIIYQIFEAPGAAFPSSHVSVALCTLYFTALYLPRIRRLHFVVVVLLCLSTVYCRHHYLVDVFAGVITAALLIPLGNRLYRRYGEQPEGLALPRPPASPGPIP